MIPHTPGPGNIPSTPPTPKPPLQRPPVEMKEGEDIEELRNALHEVTQRVKVLEARVEVLEGKAGAK